MGHLWGIPQNKAPRGTLCDSLWWTEPPPLKALNITHLSCNKHITITHCHIKHSILTSKLCTVFSDACKFDSASFLSAIRLSQISYTVQCFICQKHVRTYIRRNILNQPAWKISHPLFTATQNSLACQPLPSALRLLCNCGLCNSSNTEGRGWRTRLHANLVNM